MLFSAVIIVHMLISEDFTVYQSVAKYSLNEELHEFIIYERITYPSWKLIAM